MLCVDVRGLAVSPFTCDTFFVGGRNCPGATKGTGHIRVVDYRCFAAAVDRPTLAAAGHATATDYAVKSSHYIAPHAHSVTRRRGWQSVHIGGPSRSRTPPIRAERCWYCRRRTATGTIFAPCAHQSTMDCRGASVRTRRRRLQLWMRPGASPSVCFRPAMLRADSLFTGPGRGSGRPEAGLRELAGDSELQAGLKKRGRERQHQYARGGSCDDGQRPLTTRSRARRTMGHLGGHGMARQYLALAKHHPLGFARA